jgi:hypothetical protein
MLSSYLTVCLSSRLTEFILVCQPSGFTFFSRMPRVHFIISHCGSSFSLFSQINLMLFSSSVHLTLSSTKLNLFLSSAMISLISHLPGSSLFWYGRTGHLITGASVCICVYSVRILGHFLAWIVPPVAAFISLLISQSKSREEGGGEGDEAEGEAGGGRQAYRWLTAPLDVSILQHGSHNKYSLISCDAQVESFKGVSVVRTVSAPSGFRSPNEQVSFAHGQPVLAIWPACGEP